MSRRRGSRQDRVETLRFYMFAAVLIFAGFVVTGLKAIGLITVQ